MPIIDSRDDAPETNKDVKRHHDKVKDAIKKKLPEIISDADIITQDNKGKKVRVPIKVIDIPDLRHGKRKKNEGEGEGEDGDGEGGGQGGKAGIGQGPGKKGDIIGKAPAQGEGEGKGSKAGNQPGSDELEAEFTMEEIIQMMMEDLGLPNLTKKSIATLEVKLGFKIEGQDKVGPMVLFKRRKTARNAVKTFWAFMGILMDKFKDRGELDCFAALKETSGTLYEAENLLADKDWKHEYKIVEPFPIIGNDDMCFFEVKDKHTSETNAIIFAILDVSGSMSDAKKYVARAILFWMVQFLRSQYTNVDIKFIVHHTEAREVKECDFFRTVESGGTFGGSAFKIANEMIKDKFPTDLWNVYTFYFSDGEDFAPNETMAEMKKMMDSGINLLGFANIKDDFDKFLWQAGFSSGADLIKKIKAEWPVVTTKVPMASEDFRDESQGDDIEVITGGEGFPFLAVTISDKAHILPTIREFLKKDR